MVKSRKDKAPKPPQPPCETVSSSDGQKIGRTRRKTTATGASGAQQSEGSNDEPEVAVPGTVTLKVPARVIWDKYPECHRQGRIPAVMCSDCCERLRRHGNRWFD